jgi:hypothetical protein
MSRVSNLRALRLAALVALTALAAACSSGDDDGNAATATGASAPADPSGATGGTSVACELFTQADAEAVFGAPVERVQDAVEQGLITASAIPPGTEVCYYRPTPDDGSRFAAVAVLPPGALTEEEYRAQVADGLALGGPGEDGFDVNGSIITRIGDTVVLAVATTIAGKANDPSAGLEIATLVVSRLPPPEPDTDNPACALLTEELAESVVGVDLVFDSDQIVDEQRSGCAFHDAAGPTSVILQMTQGPDAAAGYRTIHESAADSSGFREIEGLGDEAFVVLDAFVLSGDTVLKITVFIEDGTGAEEALEVARAVVAKL